METTIFDDLPSLKKAIEEEKVDMITMTGLDYLEIEKEMATKPSLVGVSGEGVTKTYVVLVRADSGIKKIEQLKGRKLLSESGTNGQIALRWLDVVLMQRGFPEARDFFKPVKLVEKASKAILPVFFKQADACVVSREAFNTMLELNPQIGKSLMILVASPAFLDNVVFFRSGYDEKSKNDLIESGLKFNEEPEGQQVLMLFRKTRIVRFQPEYLETLRLLQRDYEELKAKKAR
jgi:ABC-type phosphate/phosphonate transport system substrate-binding protein